MYLQIRRTQKSKSEHQQGKKNSLFSSIPHDLNSNYMNSIYPIHTSIGHVFVPHSYNTVKRKYNWDKKREIVERAIFNASVHLEDASRDSMIQDHPIVKNAIHDIISIFNDPALELYPFFGQSDGLAMIGENKISIRTSLIKDALEKEESFYRLEKTLIHEAFHIIGGCVEGQSEDLICEDSVGKDCAFDKIVSKNSIQEMEADDFAQFIMMC